LGAHYRFSCPACNYAAVVSGGTDRGFTSGTMTISCHECKQLYDVATVLFAHSKEEPHSVRKHEKRLPLRCPEFPLHTVQSWEHPGICPRCGTMMGRGELEVLWD
jgi:hypothetical protein